MRGQAMPGSKACPNVAPVPVPAKLMLRSDVPPIAALARCSTDTALSVGTLAQDASKAARLLARTSRSTGREFLGVIGEPP